ncbi:probable Ribose-5-phosphate isomerase [Zygosaccharomyces bailii]|nr:probable Ribose-5-phosphate isomerase [Zygosaccharomyces bailii]
MFTPSTSKGLVRKIGAIKRFMASIKLPKISELPVLGHPLENAKRAAAYRAVDENLDVYKHRVIGIGSGSTVVYVAQRIGQYLKDDEYRDYVSKFTCVATGYQSKQLIIENGLSYGIIEQYPYVDIAFDGADEIDPNLNLIKGGGACLFQEKLVSTSTKLFIVVADTSKKSYTKLGSRWTQGVPVEVVPVAFARVQHDLLKLLNARTVTLRQGGKSKMGPVVTDNMNFILDACFGDIDDPGTLHQKIKSLVGVVETGLFVDNACKCYLGDSDGEVHTIVKESV